MKHFLRFIGIIALAFVILVGGLDLLNRYLEYKNCLCSIATEEHQTREIDNMIRAHYDVGPNIGTFSLISFECPHHKHIMAEVFPAANRYTFWMQSK
ncbi:MAG: hypothetical protein IKO52_06530 [Clostridia bacterium]|nr:hypothetical protein [Clostridia bacterium]